MFSIIFVFNEKQTASLLAYVKQDLKGLSLTSRREEVFENSFDRKSTYRTHAKRQTS